MTTWGFLSRLIAFRPWLWTINLGSISLLIVLETVPGLLARSFFDWLGAGARDWQPLWWVLALLAATAIGRIMFLVGCQLTNAPFIYMNAALLQKNMLGRTLELPGAAALSSSSGEAISRYRDDVDEATLFLIPFNDMVAFVAFALVGLAVMLSISPTITLGVFVPLAVLVGIVQAARTRIEAYRHASRTATGNVTGFLAELFAAAPAVQAAAADERVVDRFRLLNDVRMAATIRDRVFDQLLVSVSRNATNFGTGLILLLVARSMQAGSFSVGDFALFVFYLGWIGEFTNLFGQMLAMYSRVGVSVGRMTAVLRGAAPARLVQHGSITSVVTPSGAEADALRVLTLHGLSYRHPSSARGIEDVTLSVARDECVVVTGRIGAGKTTLLRCALGLLPRDHGVISWNGDAIDDPAGFMVPPRVAYTPQVPRLFSESLRNNVLLGLSASDTELDAALAIAQLTPDLAELRDGLDTAVGPRGVSLSGGQVQRTAAARMVVRRPELLVLDDLSALDVDTEARLWERLRANRQWTILAASHRRAALQAADQIVVLQDGVVIATGTLADLLDSCDEMRALWQGVVAMPTDTPQPAS
jgi:ATP-binding cassette subfamily B protein